MPIRALAPLELVHIDFTSVESTMELNKPPSVKNVLVIMDHFTCYAMAVMMKDQMAKTVAEVLYERFITVFGMPAKLLRDQGVNFILVLVEEFRMIGKLASDKKAQWEQHLLKLLQAFNSMRSAITGYSPHYLMFGRHPHLPVDFYFPTKGAHVCSC